MIALCPMFPKQKCKRKKHINMCVRDQDNLGEPSGWLWLLLPKNLGNEFIHIYIFGRFWLCLIFCRVRNRRPMNNIYTYSNSSIKCSKRSAKFIGEPRRNHLSFNTIFTSAAMLNSQFLLKIIARRWASKLIQSTRSQQLSY